MLIQSYLPENELLKNFIECFYILERLEKTGSDSFLILPSVNAYVSISLNTVTSSDKSIVTTKGVNHSTFDSSLQIALKSPQIYKYQGPVKEICIKFKPLGIYSFFDPKEINKTIKNKKPPIAFEKNKIQFRKILKSKEHRTLLKSIENYLLENYKPFVHPYLIRAMNMLQINVQEEKPNMELLSATLNISRQTLKNQFCRYLNLSPSEFRQIQRFRKFIELKLADNTQSQLTDLVYDIGFFDQSHLIKYFRKYAFLNPKQFFKKVNFSENSSVLLIWQ